MIKYILFEKSIFEYIGVHSRKISQPFFSVYRFQSTDKIVLSFLTFISVVQDGQVFNVYVFRVYRM